MSIPNILPNQPFVRTGDKVNSDYYEEFLLKIYKDRDARGLSDNFRGIHHLVVEVDPGTAHNYISELLIMTPYNYVRSFEDTTYRYHLLRITNDNPDFIVREQLNQEHSRIWSLNQLSKNGKLKPFTRYIGEVINVKNLAEVNAKLIEQEVKFLQEFPAAPHKNYIHWTEESIFTWNSIGYIQEQTGEKEYMFDREFHFSADDLELFAKMKQLQSDLEINKYIEPIDHLATRIYCHDREHAILEYLTLSSYYFWGGYNIGDQNSSTNINRSIHSDITEANSPAKVFTANNTPFYVNHITKLPSPTENFVRQYGRRMHHMAYAVKDGYIGAEENNYKNVDFVVDQLKSVEKEFLADVIGSCGEGLKQIFSKGSMFSYIITEYIQRCDNYEGFFTVENVAALTAAAGKDDMIN
jgi:hypothetical protein